MDGPRSVVDESMRRASILFNVSGWLALLGLISWCASAGAHGGVFFEEDLCVIQIGFFKAHFTVYQPETRASTEYCEDIPDATETVFVLDYLHQSLREMPVDFRIIRDMQGLGRFARWEDVVGLEDLEADTVFYQPPVTRSDAAFTVEHTFEEHGSYIGIVTTRHPTEDRSYNAVFPFEVGGGGYGYLPLLIGLAIFLQANYWIMTGGLARWRARRAGA